MKPNEVFPPQEKFINFFTDEGFKRIFGSDILFMGCKVRRTAVWVQREVVYLPPDSLGVQYLHRVVTAHGGRLSRWRDSVIATLGSGTEYEKVGTDNLLSTQTVQVSSRPSLFLMVRIVLALAVCVWLGRMWMKRD